MDKWIKLGNLQCRNEIKLQKKIARSISIYVWEDGGFVRLWILRLGKTKCL